MLFHLLFFLTHFRDLLLNALFAVALTYYIPIFWHCHCLVPISIYDLYFMTSSLCFAITHQLKSLLYCSYSHPWIQFSLCTVHYNIPSVCYYYYYYWKSGEDIIFLVPIFFLPNLFLFCMWKRERQRDKKVEKGKRSALSELLMI